MDDLVHIGLSCTKNYLIHVIEVINSLVTACSNYKYAVHIVVDCSELETKSIKSLLDGFGIENINFFVYSSICFEHYIEKNKSKVRMDLSKMTYARLFLDAFLAPNIERILWLEADLLITNNRVSNLFDMPFDDCYAIGVVDPSIMAFRKDEMNNTQSSHYLNGGIISFNIALMRQCGVFSQVKHFMQDIPDWFAQHNFADQTIINYIMHNKIKFIDGAYNIQSIMFGYPQYDAFAKECGYANQFDMMNHCIVSHTMGAKPWESKWDTWQAWQLPMKHWQKKIYNVNRQMCINKFGQKYLDLAALIES